MGTSTESEETGILDFAATDIMLIFLALFRSTVLSLGAA
jgi:hypothetical protein